MNSTINSGLEKPSNNKYDGVIIESINNIDRNIFKKTKQEKELLKSIKKGLKNG